MQTRVTRSRVALAIVLGLVAAAAVAGCVEDPEQLAQESRQPLAAYPESVELGAIRRGTEASARVELGNQGSDEIIIGSIELQASAPCVPPDPCLRAEPCHISLIAPCVRPGDSTVMTVSCTPTVAGRLAFTAGVHYRSSSGASYQLDVPINGTVR